MARKKTGWQDNTKSFTARFNITDEQQRRAVDIIETYRAGGRSVQSILTTALLASVDSQYHEPSLGDTAAYQIMLSVQELGEILLELKQLRTVAVMHNAVPNYDDADEDLEDSVMDYMKSRGKK